MESKTFRKILVVSFLVLIFGGCNKTEVLLTEEDLAPKRCNESIIKSATAEYKGDPIYGEPLEIEISEAFTPQGELEPSKPYLQKPNGTIVQTAEYKIDRLTEEDEGTYYAFYANRYCASKKHPLTVTAKDLVIPCNFQSNWVDISGMPEYSNVSVTNTTIVNLSASKKRILVYGSNPTAPVLTIEINTPSIETGKYEMFSASSRLSPSSIAGRRAFVEFVQDGSPKFYFVNYTGASLYVKQIQQNTYEFIICDEPFSVLGTPPFRNVKARVIVTE